MKDHSQLDSDKEIFFTIDNDGDDILENAVIYKATPAVARAALLANYHDSLYHKSTACIEAGSFADCWKKRRAVEDRDFLYYHLTTKDRPLDADTGMYPICDGITEKSFVDDELICQPPGQHPGGSGTWITLREKVYVVSSIEERR